MSTIPFNPQCIAFIFSVATVLCFLIVYLARCKMKSQELKHKETMEDKRKDQSKEKDLLDALKKALKECISSDCKEVTKDFIAEIVKESLKETSNAAKQELDVAKGQIEIYEKFLTKKS